MKKPVLGVIDFYRRFLSPTLPPSCRFHPSCSDYAHDAISQWGLVRGGLLAIWRLLRCHPFAGGGFDPVPKVWRESMTSSPSRPQAHNIDKGRSLASLHRRSSNLRSLWLMISSTLFLSGCGGVAPATSWPNAAMAGDVLYVANNTNVYAINPERGTLNWQFPQEGTRDAAQFYSAPALTESAVVVGSFDKKAFALEMDTGREIWRFDASDGRSGSAPTAISVAKGLVYMSSGNTLYSLNPVNGQEVWRFQTEADLWAAPVADDERLYLPSMDHHLYALDLQTGREVWRQELDGALPDTPTLTDGVLYLGVFANHAYAIDTSRGQILWAFDTEGWVWGSPSVLAGVAYFGDLDGAVYAVRVSNARILWKIQLDGAVRGAPSIVDETLFVNTEDGFVYCLSRSDGSQLWRVEVDSDTAERLLAEPVQHDGVVFVTAMGGESLVYAYNQETGLLEWQFPVTK